MGRRDIPTLAALALFWWGTVFIPANGHAREKIRTVAGIPPIAWAVEQVGGDLVTVDVLLPSGVSPETYAPTPQALTVLTEANILFTIGVPFELRIRDRIKDFAAEISLIDVTQNIELRQFDEQQEHGSHGHGLADPHMWLDPIKMCTVIENIAVSLSTLDPDGGSVYRLRADSAKSRLRELDEDLRVLLSPVKGGSVFVYHPSFGYFTDRYGLNQIAIERDGKEASARQLGELIARAKREQIGVLFTQPQFPRRQAEVVAGEIGAKVAVVDQLSRDYLTMMYDLGEKVAESLEKPVVSE